MTDSSDAYELPDPELRAYDHGLGTLSVDGKLKGYLASVVTQMTFPSRRPWLWFVVTWADGTREPRFDDYGPGWPTVRELDAGFFDDCEPSVRKERRVLWMRIPYLESGLPCRYDFAWLPAEQAAKKWQELGLTDADF